MQNVTKQFSSMEKIRFKIDDSFGEISEKIAIKGERLSYQIALNCDGIKRYRTKVFVDSPLSDFVKIYTVKDVYMDLPLTEDFDQEDYITKEPGLMPDVLIPIDEQNNIITISQNQTVLWVRVDIPNDIKADDYSVKVNFETTDCWGDFNKPLCTIEKEMKIKVIDAVLPEQKLKYTRWFYIDCIATAHNVELFSEKHWYLIEEYIKAAVDSGINMLLVPIHTPPVDTESGWKRPCVQLVDIEKTGEKYNFNFERFHRYINICKKCGIKYFEMAHMFTQWGAKYTPNILVEENGKSDYLFGWNVSANSKEYSDFLEQYVKAIITELEKAEISENTYFHISDEPNTDNIYNYEKAVNLIKPLIGKCKVFDALSHTEFYEKGLVKIPVTCINEMDEFLKLNIPEQWTYYCCGPQSIYPNSFLALPSYRIRVLGFMLYKYNIKGFLHWGLNFYNSFKSWYYINPYLSTSADGAFPSGDGFILYPSRNGAYGSIRGEMMHLAIEDMNVCYCLENLIGRDAVIRIIDEFAEGELRFDKYPKNKEFIENLRQRLAETINEKINLR